MSSYVCTEIELFGNQMCQAMFAQKWNYLVTKCVFVCTDMELFGNQMCQATIAKNGIIR